MIRRLVSAITAALLATTAAQGDTFVYVSVAAEKRIAVYRLEPGTGKLTYRFAWVSNRGHDSLAAFALGNDGRISALGQTATEKTTRSFDLDPSGKYLFAAGEASGKLAGYRIDPQTGALTRLATNVVGQMPWWVLAVELRPR